MASRFLLTREAEYEKVGSDETCETDESVARTSHRFSRARRNPYIIALAASNIATLVAFVVSFVAQAHGGSAGECLKMTSSYSPVFDRGIDLDMHVRLTNGTFHAPEQASIARQMPNPEADELWDELELTRVLPISREEVVRLGKDPETAVKLEDDIWHEGEEMYAATFDVFHLLHCLNAVRKVVYGDYYNQTMADHMKPKRLHEIHLNHCMDMLFQAISCSNNVNLMTMHWAETQNNPFPDMSINRMCINFPKLVEWRKQHTIDMAKWEDVEKPDGHAEIPWSDGI